MSLSRKVTRCPRALTLCAWLIILGTFNVGLSQIYTSLRGTVTDPQGAVVPGAAVVVTNNATGLTRSTKTGADGAFHLVQLPPGAYRISAEANGFKTTTKEGIKLLVNTPTTVRLRLELGETAQTVEVTASGARLDTVDATIGNPFNQTQVEQLPLEARNVVALLSLQPGVTYFGGDYRTESDYPGDYREGSVNGGKADQANVTLDGVDVNDQLFGRAFTSVLRVTLDSVQEFRVTTSNPLASQGRSSGAQVALVTKSGTNELHGSLYEYNRNTVTTANNFFNNSAGVQRPPLIRNIFGVSAGGPVVKDRFFFFLNYEGRRDARSESVVRTVPSADMRKGYLSYSNIQGQTVRLSPDDIRRLDPGHLGPNPASLTVFQKYPLPNDTSVGDGLNTFGFRFNSPIHAKFDTYITRLDWYITQDGKHTLFWRGNLQNDHGNEVQQFPGSVPRFVDFNNSKGFAAGYTAILKPNITNTVRWGFTRQGVQQAGASTQPRLTVGVTNLFPFTRTHGRIIPVHNIVDDAVWVKGRHTLGFGGNLTFIRDSSSNFANSFPDIGVGSTWLAGQGKNLLPADLGSGSGSFRGAMAAVLGLQSRYLSRYNYDKNGDVLPMGAAVNRRFAANEYEIYVQDSWRARSNLTLDIGLRYSLLSPPWETNGQQVAPSMSMARWLNLRGANGAKGIPSSAAPTITYNLAGPANGKPGFYGWDKNNFAPRLAFAYSPAFDSGWLKRLFGGPGKSSIRAGFAVVYDHIGSGLASAMNSVGSFGMSSVISNPAGSVNPATGPRFAGFDHIPSGVLPPAPPGGFPSTPPGAGQKGGFAISYTTDNTIRTPYSMAIDFSVQREVMNNLTFEAAYVSRLSRKLLVARDMAMPVNLYDPASKDTYFSAADKLVALSDKGTPLTAVPSIPYWENLYPSIAANPTGMVSVLNNQYGYNFPANTVLSATQVMYLIFNKVYGPDYTSALLDIDTDLNCGSLTNGSFPCSKFGPYAFYDDQFSSLQALSSIMPADYHSLQLMLRKRFSSGLQFGINYTLSRSIDWASRVEAQSFQFNNSLLVNTWAPGQHRAVSDFDIRHSINANWIAELPFGRGKRIGKTAPGWVNQLIGGWQISGIFRISSGLPTSVNNGDYYPTNWDQAGFGTRIGPVRTGTRKNAPPAAPGGKPGPNLFPDPAAAFKAYRTTIPGQTGSRNDLRGDGYFSIDMGLAKTFRLTESQHLQFRWESFNLTNTPRFDVASARINMSRATANFGKYSRMLNAPRVMQFSLRYEF